MKVAIGCDHLGLPLKREIVKLLQERTIDFQDFGVCTPDNVDYPDIAERVAEAIQRSEFDRGILVCGTGIGMAIAANKVPGIRAAVVHDPYSAERSRGSTNAQIMAMGSLVVGPQLARMLTAIWLDSEFEGGDSARKVGKISQIERQFNQTSPP
jgi:ribose 5-phosphate isomerase B